MARIYPFSGWRYDPARAGALSSLIAPPYDVITPEEGQRLAARSPYNAIWLELTPAAPADPPGAEGEAARHGRAGAWLRGWSREGILRRDGPAVYLYEQRFTHAGRPYARRTLLVEARLSPWSAGQILPHEHTLAGPKAERLALLRATNANLSPIWSLYEDGDGEVAALLAEAWRRDPAVEATDDAGTAHALRLLEDAATLERLAALLAPRPFFIADGHHRYETALAYQAEGGPGAPSRDRVLMALTAAGDPGLVVLPTHRLIQGLDAGTLERLPEGLARLFAVRDLSRPDTAQALQEMLDGWSGDGTAEGAHRFALLGPEPDRLRLLTLRDPGAAGTPPAPAVGRLDVWLAHALILHGLLGISDAAIERQEHLTYTRAPGLALREVATGGAQLALLLPPTPVEELLAVAASGAVMPQKSTYFYPKLATGLVYRRLEPDM